MRPDRILPPGLNLRTERNAFLFALAAVSLITTGIFFLRYSSARDALFRHSGRKPFLIPDAMMEEFPVLLDRVFVPLLLLMLFTPFWVLLHVLHYRRGSMSIYLMRRLPDRSLLHQQCWTLPLLGLLLTVLTTLLLLGIFTLVYIYATPAACLPLAYRRFV